MLPVNSPGTRCLCRLCFPLSISRHNEDTRINYRFLKSYQRSETVQLTYFLNRLFSMSNKGQTLRKRLWDKVWIFVVVVVPQPYQQPARKLKLVILIMWDHVEKTGVGGEMRRYKLLTLTFLDLFLMLSESEGCFQ